MVEENPQEQSLLQTSLEASGEPRAVKAWKFSLDASEVSLSSNTSSVIGAEGGHFWSHRGCGDLVGWKMLEELFFDMHTSLCPETDGEMRTTDCVFLKN